MTVVGFTITTLSGYFAKDSWERLREQKRGHSEGDNIKIAQEGDQNVAIEKAVDSPISILQSEGDVKVSGGAGNTQVSIHSPGSQQTINEKRAIRRKVESKKQLIGGIHVLTLTFQQTNGIWDSGTTFWIQLQLTGPYTSYKFTSGISKVLHDVDRTTEPKGNSEAAQKGWIEMKTSTPPLNEPIVLEIKSENEIDVKEILLAPLQS